MKNTTPPASSSRRAGFGPLALALAAALFGVLEVHSSTDTWLGLACGREILAAGRISTADVFSYTTAGHPFINQNWLAHTIGYWLYGKVSPAAVVYATWLAGWWLFAAVAIAAFTRTGSRPAACLAAAAVAFGCRDYVSARPATVGLAALATVGALLAVLREAPTGLKRRLALAALGVVLLLWSNLHGSFVFGYGLCALFLLERIWTRGRNPAAVSRAELVAFGGMLVGTLFIILVFGPFGLDNFTHPWTVAAISRFREIAEWRPPWQAWTEFPSVTRFWYLLGAGLIGWYALRSLPAAAGEQAAPRPAFIFDMGVALLGLGMALSSRRFIPLFLILAAPIAAEWAGRRYGRLTGRWRYRLRTVLLAGGWPAALALGAVTVLWAYTDLIVPARLDRTSDLLERITVFRDLDPEALDYFTANGFQGNLLTEWTWAGAVLFRAPGLKVFIDGRSQQAYRAEDLAAFFQLTADPELPADEALLLLEGYRPGRPRNPPTDAVLLRTGGGPGSRLATILQSSPAWTPALIGSNYRLYLKKDCAPTRRLAQLARAGREWRPASVAGMIGRGNLLLLADPPDPQQAFNLWCLAVYREIRAGFEAYPLIVEMLIRSRRDADAMKFITAQEARVKDPATALMPPERAQLLTILGDCRARFPPRPTP